jgi:hypothetical protein
LGEELQLRRRRRSPPGDPGRAIYRTLKQYHWFFLGVPPRRRPTWARSSLNNWHGRCVWPHSAPQKPWECHRAIDLRGSRTLLPIVSFFL